MGFSIAHLHAAKDFYTGLFTYVRKAALLAIGICIFSQANGYSKPSCGNRKLAKYN